MKNQARKEVLRYVNIMFIHNFTSIDRSDAESFSSRSRRNNSDIDEPKANDTHCCTEAVVGVPYNRLNECQSCILIDAFRSDWCVRIFNSDFSTACQHLH